MKRSVFTALILFVVSTSSWAKSIELDVYDKALGFNYSNQESIMISGMGVEVGFLLNDTTRPLFHAGLNVSGANKSKRGVFDITVGGRLYTWQESPDSFSALALGGSVRFSPLKRVGLSAHVYIAPDITASSDSTGMTDLMLRLDYQVIPQAFVYVGYRNIEVKFPGKAIDINDDVHVGLKLLF